MLTACFARGQLHDCPVAAVGLFGIFDLITAPGPVLVGRPAGEVITQAFDDSPPVNPPPNKRRR